jgi:hypothetical protein
LFAKFYAALDEINFFKTSPAGAEDPGQLSKASQFFDDALLVWCTFFFFCSFGIFRLSEVYTLLSPLSRENYSDFIYLFLLMEYNLTPFRRRANREEKRQV